MSLELALSNALSGLNVNQRALSVLSHNIANANTPGYSRQVVEQSARLLDGQGSGVKIDDVVRKIDKYLEQSIQRELSNVGEAESIADYYQRMQILLGEPGGTNSLDEYIESFFNSVQALAETPERVSFQATVINTAETLAREISGLARGLEDLRYQADQDIQEAVSFVNTQLRHLDTLNIAINRAAALGTSTAGLLDERDMALEKISEYMDIETYFKETGAVTVFTANGIGLVDDEFHQLAYKPAVGLDVFTSDGALNALQVLTYNEKGQQTREPDILISGGVLGGIDSKLKGGKFEGLHQVRDELIPDVLDQLDMLASRLRDEINAIHNDGSGYPAADELTGTRLVRANESFNWSGAMRIAVLNADGTPAQSTYVDEAYTGYRALELDFSFLDSGSGAGQPTTQTIIDEINNHFNAPPVKTVVNNLNNIQLVSNTSFLPSGSPPLFNFDFDLENISGTEGDFWVTGVTILDDTAAVVADTAGVGNVSGTLPTVSVDQANAYTFTAGSNIVTITGDTAHGLQVGDYVYLNEGFTPPIPVIGGTGNVPSGDLTGYFQVQSVSGTNSFEVQIATTALGGGVEASGNDFDILPPYHEIMAGDKERTRDSGTITADFSNNPTSTYYDIQVTVGVFNNDPVNPAVVPSTITYRVQNGAVNLLNDRYDATGLAGGGTLVFPSTPHQYIFARLVDEDGVELPKSNGSYGAQEGYLQLVANDYAGNEFTISIDELDSKQLGKTTQVPAIPGTNRGFSHYYELNNFFVSNEPTTTGDTLRGSALNFAVEQRLLDNPSLITTGDLELSLQPVDPNLPPVYTYERFIGDNSVVQRLAEKGISVVNFDPAGGIPENNLSFNGYIGEMLGYLATQTVSAENTYSDFETLLEGFQERADAISGVNMDEELANTIIYQNAYAASARVITITGELFDELLGAVR